jgi:hypothetical protein
MSIQHPENIKEVVQRACLDWSGQTIPFDQFLTIVASYGIDIPERDSCALKTIRNAWEELFLGEVYVEDEDIHIGEVWNDVTGGTGHNALWANTAANERLPYDADGESRSTRPRFPSECNE